MVNVHVGGCSTWCVLSVNTTLRHSLRISSDEQRTIMSHILIYCLLTGSDSVLAQAFVMSAKCKYLYIGFRHSPMPTCETTLQRVVLRCFTSTQHVTSSQNSAQYLRVRMRDISPRLLSNGKTWSSSEEYTGTKMYFTTCDFVVHFSTLTECMHVQHSIKITPTHKTKKLTEQSNDKEDKNL